MVTLVTEHRNCVQAHAGFTSYVVPDTSAWWTMAFKLSRSSVYAQPFQQMCLVIYICHNKFVKKKKNIYLVASVCVYFSLLCRWMCWSRFQLWVWVCDTTKRHLFSHLWAVTYLPDTMQYVVQKFGT